MATRKERVELGVDDPLSEAAWSYAGAVRSAAVGLEYALASHAAACERAMRAGHSAQQILEASRAALESIREERNTRARGGFVSADGMTELEFFHRQAPASELVVPGVMPAHALIDERLSGLIAQRLAE